MSKYKLAIKRISAVFNEFSLTYDESRKVVQAARKQLGILPTPKAKRLPKMPTEAEVVEFWETLEKSNNLRDIVLLKLCYLTGCRNKEIRNIRPEYIDLDENKIFIDQGKGHKDRYVLFADSFSLVLRAYILSLGPGARWMFPNRQGKPISERRFQQIAGEYTAKAGIDTKIHPHKLRHMLLTHLTAKGLPDAMIQLISGHASRESLAVYQHMALPGVTKEYQKAMEGKG